MAKAIRWQIPFISRKGTSYRIDIYDTYTGSVPSTWPVTLQGAENPIETEDANDDDMFAPMRGCNGTLHIIDTDGTLLEQIAPSNNTHRLVQLVSVANNTDTIEWQGFLSCDAYTQRYTGEAQVLDLNVNGVIESMDSIKFEYGNDVQGFMNIKSIIGLILQMTAAKGFEFDYVYYPYNTRTSFLVNTKINIDQVFDIKETQWETWSNKVVEEPSCKNVMERICTFMGWCMRVYGKDIYIAECDAAGTLGFETYSTFVNNPDTISTNSSTAQFKNVSDLNWTGEGHSKSITQGAKSVEITANLLPFDTEVDVPQRVPAQSMRDGSRNIVVNQYTDDEEQIVQETAIAHASMATSFDTSYTFKIWHMLEDQQEVPYIVNEGTMINAFDDLAVSGHRSPSSSKNYVGAMMSDVKNSDDYDYKGLLVSATDVDAYVALFNDINKYLIKCRSIKRMTIANGYIIVSPQVLLFDSKNTGTNPNVGGTVYTAQPVEGDKLKVVIRWGAKYLTSDLTWTNTFTFCEIAADQDTRIPIHEYHTGEFELYIYPFCITGERSIPSTDPALPVKYSEYIIKSLNISYEPMDIIGDANTENRYYKKITTEFKDEITRSCDIASNLYNRQSPSHICSTYYPISEITYGSGSSAVSVKPEIRLLNIMANYYAGAKTTMKIEAERPTGKELPLLLFTGMESTPKTYLIVAESRNWQEDTATLTLMES